MNGHRDLTPPDIESLAWEKSFEQLSDEEQRLVLEHLGSQESYERLRALVTATRLELTAAAPDLMPRPELQASLRAALRNRSTAPPRSLLAGIGKMLSRRIPTYQAVGISAAAAVVALLLFRPTPQMVTTPRERIVYVTAPDTQRVAATDQEELIRHIADSIADAMARRLERGDGNARRSRSARRSGDTGYLTRNDSGARLRSRREESVEETDWRRNSPNAYVGLANLPMLESQRRGRTLAEDSALQRFNATMMGMRN